MRAALGIVAGIALASGWTTDAVAESKARCTSASTRGQQARDAGKYTAARDAFAQCAAEGCPAMVRRDCARWQADLTQLWPSVVFGAKDSDGKDLTAVSVRVDGILATANLDGKPLDLDPGEHLFRFQTVGAPPVERSVLLRAGQKGRLVSVQLATPSTKPPTTSPAESAAVDPGIPQSAWVFGGLSVAAFGLWGYFGISGLADKSSLESQPCAKTATCDVSSVRTKFTAADIALGVGLVSGALATYLYLTHGGTRGAVPVDVNAAPSGAMATWRTTF